MPPVRTETRSKTFETVPLVVSLSTFKYGAGSVQQTSQGEELVEEACRLKNVTKKVNPIDLALQNENIYFPTTEAERMYYRTKEGKKVTPHQWAVYDMTRKIPCGKVTTYKDLCTLIGGGSPRSVGNALRNNPFAPFVPCHRIVSSELKLGGFCGEWGTESQEGSKCHKKVKMLEQECVFFSDKGVLVSKESMLWNNKDM